jgi:hypothetical protein
MTTTTLAQPVVLLDLTFRLFGLTRKVRRDEVEVSGINGDELPEEALKLSKRLVKANEYDAIVKADGETRRRVGELALPFKRGVYAVPLKLVARVVSMLQEREAVRDAEIARFIGVYDEAVEQARTDLGPLFRADEYPAAAEVRACFGFEWSFIELQAAGGLKQISEQLYQAQERKLAEEWERSAQTMRDSLRAAFSELVSSLRERLEGERESGKAKIFRDSRVENLRKWVAIFSDRNVTGDGELAEMVSQADRLLAGTTADDLRKDQNHRKCTAEALAAIEKGVGGLIVKDAPKRKFRFGAEKDCEDAA